ncbi:transketolase-like protein 2 [Arapaima gigas]
MQWNPAVRNNLRISLSLKRNSAMDGYEKPDHEVLQGLRDMANKLRIHSIRATCASSSGHPTSCCSAAEIMSVLFFHTMRFKAQDPRDASSDRFVMSKGHAAPILYAAWVEVGFVTESKLLDLRKLHCELEGHPTPKMEFVDVATGSLGQGLGAACGMAYTGKYFDKSSYRVYCLLGDGECSEGAVWEAMAFASYYHLDNLVAILDVNRLGQSEPTPLQHDTEAYRRRCQAFGWNAYIVDGHDVEDLCRGLWQAKQEKGLPTAIIAKTFKGKGLEGGIENEDNWHGKPLPEDCVEALLSDLQKKIQLERLLCPKLPVEDAASVDLKPISLPSLPTYKLGDKVATRRAYGVALAKLGDACQRVVALDGDTKNSTFAEIFKKSHPERYIECFIAEQNMVSVAVGCAARDRCVPFASTFGAFLSRAYDQDGPSQMALEDLAMFRAIPTCTIFYPCDAVSTERAIELAANTKGICFIRTTRPETPVIYPAEEKFEVGCAKVVHQSENDKVTIIGAGVTLHEALTAAEELATEGLSIKVIDPFTIKPLDTTTIVSSAKATGGRLIVVEDHYKEGGLGEAVCSIVAKEHGIVVQTLAVTQVPQSGRPQELLDLYSIGAKAIVKAVKDVIAN